MTTSEATTYYADLEGNCFCRHCVQHRGICLSTRLTRIEGRLPPYTCTNCGQPFGPGARSPKTS